MRRVISDGNIFGAESGELCKLPHLGYIEKELAKIFSPVLPMWSASTVAWRMLRNGVGSTSEMMRLEKPHHQPK